MELRKENWKIMQLQENYPELWSCSKNIRPKIAVLTPSGQISHLQTLSSCHTDILTSSVILHHQVQAGERRNIAWASEHNEQGTWSITANWKMPQMNTVKGQWVETPQNLRPPPFFFYFQVPYRNLSWVYPLFLGTWYSLKEKKMDSHLLICEDKEYQKERISVKELT